VRRSELLALTGVTPARFGNIFHRGQLPFGDPNAERQGWADYSLDEAVQLALMLRLMVLEWPIEAQKGFGGLGLLARRGNGGVSRELRALG